ncbi:MAG: PadR family transcriptional regulator [Chloroflexi bacterium]|nr:MAG: PadR family transcriptional regulator [Chloroflexota bacterium]MBL1196122.1 PadR family transcriptional regulator [Chloroflexota bacterium]NOH13415.1 PadR family transcriptional regulator [Chloroflexota bacterium]
MERKLLLLGLLRQQPMYGYQINDLIDTHLGTGVALSKPTAYRFLNQMAEEGWIEFQEEQEGNRPPRRVYSILPAGETAFQEMLRESLADFSPTASYGVLGIAFLDAIPIEEALPLLQTRRKLIEDSLDALTVDEEHQGGFGFVILHQIQHLKAELLWLDDVIQHYAEGETTTNNH